MALGSLSGKRRVTAAMEVPMNAPRLAERSSLELIRPLLWLAAAAFTVGFGGYWAVAGRALGL